MTDDAILLERAKQGDTEAFDRLWLRYRDQVFRSLLKACVGNPDTTHDVLQDALLNAFRLRHLALHHCPTALHPCA